MGADKAPYSPYYRQQDVDRTLDDHDSRIERLEKAGLVVLGYGVAEGANVVYDIGSLLL